MIDRKKVLTLAILFIAIEWYFMLTKQWVFMWIFGITGLILNEIQFRMFKAGGKND